MASTPAGFHGDIELDKAHTEKPGGKQIQQPRPVCFTMGQFAIKPRFFALTLPSAFLVQQVERVLELHRKLDQESPTSAPKFQT